MTALPRIAPPRIAYDARLSLGSYRGMGRYLRSLIAGREQQLLGLCATGEYDPALRLIAHGMHAYPLWEQVSIPRLVRQNVIDVLIAPYNTAPLLLPKPARLILVVHDLIYLEPLPLSESLYQNAGRLYRRSVTPRAIPRADLILTVSEYTARQIHTRFAVDPARLRVIPNSIGKEWYATSPRDMRERDTREGKPPGFILTVAGEAPSKNLARALQAFALCRNSNNLNHLKMKIAGVKPSFHPTFQAQAAALGIADAVQLLPYLSDVEMQSLYREAEVLLMPSLAEGFGIPVLEAMAAGLPVVSSNAASLPEVGGEAAIYFDPLSVEQMADTLHRTLFDGQLREVMADRGRTQALRFHPDLIHSRVQSFWNEIEEPVKLVPTREFASC